MVSVTAIRVPIREHLTVSFSALHNDKTRAILGIEFSGRMSADDLSLDSSDAIAWYDDHAEALVERHESVAPEKVNDWLKKPFAKPAGSRVRRWCRLGTGRGLVGFPWPSRHRR